MANTLSRAVIIFLLIFKTPVFAGTITGEIIDNTTQKPIVGADIEIKNKNLGVGYYRVTSNSQGVFTLEDYIPDIEYKAEIRAEGYVTKTINNFHPKQNKIFLNRESIIEGTVLTSKEEPLSDVTVFIWDYYSESNQRIQVKTDSKGYYKFTKLNQGNFTVTFQKDHYLNESARIQRVSPEKPFLLNMQMFKPSSVSGKILIKDTEGPESAKNVYVSLSGVHRHSTKTFSDGSFQIFDLKPGSYTFDYSHNGYIKSEPIQMEVKEDENITLDDIYLTIRDASLSIYTSNYTFPTGSNIGFTTQTFRIDKMKLTIYDLNEEKFPPSSADDLDIENLPKVHTWEEPVKNYEPNEYKHGYVNISQNLPTGMYCIEISSEDGSTLDRKLFTVTTLGLIAKRTESGILVYAVDLVTSEVLKDVKIKTYVPETETHNNNGTDSQDNWGEINGIKSKAIAEGLTDENGLLELKGITANQIFLYGIAPNGSFASLESNAPSELTEKFKFYIYTDRPTYRAGDTVHYKIIAKEDKEVFVPFRGKDISLTLNNYSGEIPLNPIQLDDWGTAEGKFEIPGDFSLGRQTLNISGKTIEKGREYKLSGDGTFYVEQYRKPEYKIDISSSKSFYANGDEIEFKVSANYLYGAPVEKAGIQYKVYEKKLSDRENNYWWESGYNSSAYYYNVLEEGNKFLDKEGNLVIRLKPRILPFDREIILETSVTDSSNVRLEKEKRIILGRGEFYIKLIPNESYYTFDDKKIIKIKTLDHSGKGVSKSGTLSFHRYVWKPWQKTYSREPKALYETKFETDENGEGELVLEKEINASSEIEIVAKSTDSRENQILATRLIWVHDGISETNSLFKNLELTVNQSALSEGEITVVVKSKYKNVPVLLTLEGKKIYDATVVKLENHIITHKFKVDESYSPNFYVTASLQINKNLFRAYDEVVLGKKDTEIVWKIDFDKEKYRPGEKLHLKVHAENSDAKPLSTDFSLALVDEAIYLIREDFTDPIRNYFYSKINNRVSTIYSFPMTLLAGNGKDGESPPVRDDFRDTAFWLANGKTDMDGNAEIEIDLPDNLTTWRATLRGHDLEGRMGDTISKTIVTKELITRIGKPMFFTEGDKVELPLNITNNSEKGLPEIKTDFFIDGKVTESGSLSKISLPENSSASGYYPISIDPDKNDLKIKVVSVSGEFSDAQEISVPIHKRGAEYRYMDSMKIQSDKPLSINIPESIQKDFLPESLELNVNRSPFEKVDRSIQIMKEYPYTCTEQTLSKEISSLISNLYSLALEKSSSIKKGDGPEDSEDMNSETNDPEEETNSDDNFDLGENEETLIKEYDSKSKSKQPLLKLDEKSLRNFQRVINSMNSDGTWGFWSGDLGNEYLTAYAIESLTIAGRVTDLEERTSIKNQMTRGLKALERILKKSYESDPLLSSYIVYVLSMHNIYPIELTDSVVEKLSAGSSYSASYILRALQALEKAKPEDSKRIRNLNSKIFVQMETFKRKDNRGVYYDTDSNLSQSGWNRGKLENSSLVLTALLEADNESDLNTELFHSILNRISDSAEGNTKALSSAHKSLFFYMAKSGMDPSKKTKGKLIGRIGDTKLEFDLAKDNTIKIPYPKGEDKIFFTPPPSLEKQGLSLDVIVRGNLNPDLKEFGSLNHKFQIERSFYRLNRVRDAKNLEYSVPEKLDESPLSIGEEIMVKVKLTTEEIHDFVLLEEYLPSTFVTTSSDAYNSTNPRHYSHFEKWDNRLVYFLPRMVPGKTYEISYILRSELPGTFRIKPSRVECMYDSSRGSYSKPVDLKVMKKDEEKKKVD
ncbi:MAG: carboxypeptidase regulatory-like domain-containing protein [Leptospiraceae bacterium]|nr:carboxypeptidase regulatory-like domain-containing protein [Leptospiraceae bacterium]